MAFVLPNGTVVDPDRDDREMILKQIAQRRQLAQQDRNSQRSSELQAQMIGAEMQSANLDREQNDRLTQADMAQREHMAASAETALTSRMEKEQKAARDAFAEEQIRTVDAEEEQASGIAKRINDMIKAHDAIRPDPAKDPDGFRDWQIGRARIRQQVPINYEGALFEKDGVWQVDPGFFKVKRSRWMSAPKVGTSALASAVAAVPEPVASPSIASAIAGSGAVPPRAPMVPALPPMDRLGIFAPSMGQPQVDPSLIAALSASQQMPAWAGPVGGSMPGMQVPPQLDIARALSMLSGLFGNGVPVGGMPFNLPRNNPLPTIGKYQTVGVQ